MSNKTVSPAAVQGLKEALTAAYWYKSDLRSFLTHSLGKSELLARLNWDDYKRNVVSDLVDHLAMNEEVYQRDLLKLMSDVAKITDFSHLQRLEGGPEKAKAAQQAVAALRKLIITHEQAFDDQRNIEERRKQAHDRLVQAAGVQEKLKALTAEYMALLGSDEPQRRGYRLEKILRELFELFDLDPRASFRITGEQIDGAFSFEGTDYLLEAKWQLEPVRAADLDSLAGKLSRKLDNTLGLYLSINGYSPDAVEVHTSGRRLTILVDGSDLMAVLEGRIDLLQLLLRKRREAAQTGNIYLRIHEVLT
jgi:hypothetical protein